MTVMIRQTKIKDGVIDMKKAAVNKNMINMVLMIVIMGLSIFFRMLALRAVDTERGELFYDREEGLPYLTEMDSYYHLRMTEDIINYGHPGESVVGNENWDDYSYAPDGRSAKDYSPLMADIAVCLYRIAGVFGEVITLYQIIYLMGAFISSLVVIPVFVLAKRLGGIAAAVVASVIASVNYGYFIHTVPGFYDTDMVISFASCFMLCFGCLFALSIFEKPLVRSGDDVTGVIRLNRICQVIFGLLFAFSIFVLYRAWNVYSLYVGIFGAALFVYFIVLLIQKRNDKKFILKRNLGAPIVILGMIVFVLVIDPGIFRSVMSFAGSVFNGSGNSLFPDAYVSVSEMRKPALIAGGFSGLFQMKVLSESDIGILNAVGGSIPFLAAIASIIAMIAAMVKKNVRFDYILMIVWFMVSSVLALRSFRFIVLFALPVSILTGVFAGKLFELMKTRKMMDWQIFAVMVSAVLLFPAVYGTCRSLQDSMPVVNQGLGDTVTYIRDNKPENTIIASWWDYGYFFEQKAKRRTVFDGGSQNGMRVFWIGRALATDDETLSANILRMLAGSGDDATDMCLEEFGENSDTLSLMLDVLSGGEEEGKEILMSSGADADMAERIISLMFPSAVDPVLCLITPDMYGICGWFARFGYWNEGSDKGSDFSVLINMNEYSPVDGRCGWHFKIDGQEVELFVEETQEGFAAYSRLSGDDKSDQPYPVRNIIIKKNGQIQDNDLGADLNKEGMNLSVVIDYDYGKPYVSVMSTEVADSVFGRMYYLGGEGLRNYRPDNEAGGSARVFELGF